MTFASLNTLSYREKTTSSQRYWQVAHTKETKRLMGRDLGNEKNGAQRVIGSICRGLGNTHTEIGSRHRTKPEQTKRLIHDGDRIMIRSKAF